MIRLWRDNRRRSIRKSRFTSFMVYSFRLETLRHFMLNFNFMVIVQLVIAVVSVLIFQMVDVAFEIQLPLLVSPIVFPLAFSIITDFQRREKVLEDLGLFKSSTMMWYFCMREWQKGAEMDAEWLDAVHAKLKSLLFHLHEYLLTYLPDRRKIIVRVIYEDFSDTSQLIDGIRESKLPANTAIVSRAIHLINMACLAFERLRVIREYRSPRSIRSFNKVFIMLFPIILAPHFIHEAGGLPWKPYYMSVIVTVVFAILQGVQDKLDDPFDGLSEDDINLDALDEWSSHCGHTKERQFDVNRFRRPSGMTMETMEMELDTNSAINDGNVSNEGYQEKDFLEKQLKVVTNNLVFTSLNDARENALPNASDGTQKEEMTCKAGNTEEGDGEDDGQKSHLYEDVGGESVDSFDDNSKKCPRESVYVVNDTNDCNSGDCITEV